MNSVSRRRCKLQLINKNMRTPALENQLYRRLPKAALKRLLAEACFHAGDYQSALFNKITKRSNSRCVRKTFRSIFVNNLTYGGGCTWIFLFKRKSRQSNLARKCLHWPIAIGCQVIVFLRLSKCLSAYALYFNFNFRRICLLFSD